jgi:hypothetical protein
MSRASRATIALAALSLSVRAERISLTDAGLSAWLPSGWTVQDESATDTSRLYILADTVIDPSTQLQRHSGSILLMANSGASNGTTPHDWVSSEADALALSIEYASIFHVLQFNDSTYWEGLYAREVFGTYQDDPSDSITTLFAKIAAHGDLGWEVWIQADKSDADTAIFTYAAIVDSVLPDTGLQGLPRTAVQPRPTTTDRLSSALSSVGGRIRIVSSPRPDFEAFDLRGRPIAGSLALLSDGLWVWTPEEASRSRPVVARLHADGRTRSARMVLAP